MVDDDNLSSTEELLRDNDRPKSIYSSSTGVAYDVTVSLLESQRAGWVNSRVHAYYSKHLPINHSLSNSGHERSSIGQ